MCKTGYGCVQYTNWWDPFPDNAYAGALVHRAALSKTIISATSLVCWVHKKIATSNEYFVRVYRFVASFMQAANRVDT